MSRRALSATRTADLLNFLAAHPDESLSYSELSRRLQINLASTHSLLMALTECGYLTRDPRDRSFSLGPALVAIGDAALRENPIVDESRVEMRRLSHELDMGAMLVVRAGTDALCIARADPRHPRGASTQVGQRVPIMAPLTAIFVAWAPDEEVEQWLLRGGGAAAERRRQRAVLGLIRERGYSVALEMPGRQKLGSLVSRLADDPHSPDLRRELRETIQELGRRGYPMREGHGGNHNVSTISAPVFGRHGEVSAGVTLEVFADALEPARVEAIGERLLEATRAISRA